eukprot:3111417-Prymnesium_polylepis.8
MSGERSGNRRREIEPGVVWQPRVPFHHHTHTAPCGALVSSLPRGLELARARRVRFAMRKDARTTLGALGALGLWWYLPRDTPGPWTVRG